MKTYHKMTEAIYNRKSVRTFINMPLSHDDLNQVKLIIASTKMTFGPFGNQIELHFHESPYLDETKKIQIGTYGFIKNPPSFISGVTKNNFYNLVDFGYVFEILVLELTKIDLGTVWLGGTFHRKIFNNRIEKDEIVPAVTPVGYTSEKMSIRDKLIRKVSKGDQRHDFSALFFDTNFDKPLDQYHKYSKYLELVRIAPSASNKQPWRVVVNNNNVFFYLKRTSNYGNMLSYDIQALDMGIALCHFEMGLIEDGVQYIRQYNETQCPNPDMTYVMTFSIE